MTDIKRLRKKTLVLSAKFKDKKNLFEIKSISVDVDSTNFVCFLRNGINHHGCVWNIFFFSIILYIFLLETIHQRKTKYTLGSDKREDSTMAKQWLFRQLFSYFIRNGCDFSISRVENISKY